MGAGFAQGLPAIGEGQFPADALAARLERDARHAEADDRLHRGDDAQFLEARNVGRVDQFDMLDPMAGIAPPLAWRAAS